MLQLSLVIRVGVLWCIRVSEIGWAQVGSGDGTPGIRLSSIDSFDGGSCVKEAAARFVEELPIRADVRL